MSSSSPLDWMSDVMRELGLLSPGDPTPEAEDQAFLLSKLNRMLGQWNNRKRNAYYIRSQTFAFTASQQSYTIGASGSGADFILTGSQQRPPKIERANLVLVSGTTPYIHQPMEVVNLPEYAEIRYPSESGAYPCALYYQAAFPRGVIYPYPAFPTGLTNQLELFFWNQLVSIAKGDIATAIELPDGYEDAIILSLAESCLTAYPVRTNIEMLIQLAGKARANIQSLNVSPPRIATNMDALDHCR